MHPSRIAVLLQPFLSPTPNPCHSEPGQRPGEEPAVLAPDQLQDISTYIDILLQWNTRINLTAIRDPEEIVIRHFGESLFAARHLFPKESDREGHDFSLEPALSERSESKGADIASDKNRDSAPEGLADARIADLGSGAGFPGIPIKLWAPSISLTLIESNQKKATFLREMIRALTLTDVNIQNVRAETLSPATFDVITLRAVERFTNILPVAATLLAPSGRLALLISSRQRETARSTLPYFIWDPPTPIPQTQSRELFVGHLEPRK
jgi:16S rRNA (guanine527-N7)-methyltransferase